MMTNIHATVERGEKYWVAHFTVDGMDYGTQARRYNELEEMVKDAAALMTDRPANSFTVTLSLVDRALAHALEEYRRVELQYRSAIAEHSRTSRKTIAALQKSGLTTRETAAMLGITAGRVSQLAGTR